MKKELSDIVNQPVVKHSVNISGHATSISLEKPFWDILKADAHNKNMPLAKLISDIDDARSVNLSSALRLYALDLIQNS